MKFTPFLISFIAWVPNCLCQMTFEFEPNYATSLFSEVTDHSQTVLNNSSDFKSFDKFHVSSGPAFKGGVRYDALERVSIGIRVMYLQSNSKPAIFISTVDTSLRSKFSRNFSLGPSIEFPWLTFNKRWSISSRLWLPVILSSRYIQVDASGFNDTSPAYRSEYVGRARLGFESGLLLNYRINTTWKLGITVAIYANSFHAKSKTSYIVSNGEFDRSLPHSQIFFVKPGEIVTQGQSEDSATLSFSHLDFGLSLHYTPPFLKVSTEKANQGASPSKPSK